jgi:hypothetical protein
MFKFAAPKSGDFIIETTGSTDTNDLPEVLVAEDEGIAPDSLLGKGWGNVSPSDLLGISPSTNKARLDEPANSSHLLYRINFKNSWIGN